MHLSKIWIKIYSLYFQENAFDKFVLNTKGFDSLAGSSH